MSGELGQELLFLQRLLIGEYGKGTSRAFIEALITAIAFENKMQLRPEEKLYVKDLPNSIADYVIYNHKSEALGVVEAKTGGSLNADSLIQCMLQLLALHTKAPHTLFGVVTNAFRFVFVVLTEDGMFEFERDPYLLQKGYYDMSSWQDLKTVSGIFNGLLQRRRRFVSKHLKFSLNSKSS